MTQLLDANAAVSERPGEDAAALYELYRQRVREYCYGQLRDRQEAEDALQTTFLYAFTLLQRGTKPKRPLPWLYTIAHNVCRTRRRALRRRKRIESGVDLETLHDSVGRNDPSRDDVAELASSLTTLPAAQREALLLREWQGLSYNEIAERLGLTESAVEAVLFRARRNLARTLRPVGERVASAVNGLLLLPALRRFAHFGGSARMGTAALVAGTAAATTLLPLADAPPRVAARAHAVQHIVRPHDNPAPSHDVVRNPVGRRAAGVSTGRAPQVSPAAPQPTPAPPATPPQRAAEPVASAPAPAPAPAPAAAASAPVASTPAPSASSPPSPAVPAPAAPAAPAVPAAPAAPAAVQTAVSTAGSAADSAATTVTDVVANAAQTVGAVTSGVQSTVDSTVSAVTGAVPKLPHPTTTPLQGNR